MTHSPPEDRPHVLVCGGRNFDAADLLWRKLDLWVGGWASLVVVTGACPRGADLLAERWAFAGGHTVVRFHADWDAHGKAAGPVRNTEMADWFAAVTAPRLAVAVWDGESRGTADCVAKLKARKITPKYLWY